MWTDLAGCVSNGLAPLLMALQATQQGGTPTTQPITVTSVATGAIGVIFGGLVTYLFHWARERSRDRTQNAIAFFEELHSEEMLKARVAARQTIEAYPQMNIQQLYEFFANQKTLDSYVPISTVFHFFEKVQVFVQHKQINETLARKLLGYYVWDWHHRHHDQLSLGVTDPEFRGWMAGFNALKERIGREGQGM